MLEDDALNLEEEVDQSALSEEEQAALEDEQRRQNVINILLIGVDRRGSSVTTGEAYAALFEDAEDTLSGKSYFRTILHEMVNTLKKAGVEEILVKGRNSYAVLPEKLDCDYYRFLQGDPAAVNAFQNDYMAAYSWAEIRNAELGFKME